MSGVLAVSDVALVVAVVVVVVAGLVAWAVTGTWLDDRRTRREEAAMRRDWRGLP